MNNPMRPFKQTRKTLDLLTTGNSREDARIVKALTKRVSKTINGAPLAGCYMLQKRLAEKYVTHFNKRLPEVKKIYQAADAAEAETNLLYKKIIKALKTWALDSYLIYDAAGRERLALTAAAECHGLFATLIPASGALSSDCLGRAFFSISRVLNRYGIETPQQPKDDKSTGSLLLRFICDKWVLRQLNAMATQKREHIEIVTGFVNKFQPYLSKNGLKEYQEAKRKSAAFLDAFILVNDELEQEYSLRDAAAAGVSNPENRRNELMVRAKGLEETASDKGMQGYFLTITAPSVWHANKGEGYNGATPKETQKYLAECWKQVRAKYAKHKIDFMGLRTAEPHKDGTPHWHVLIYFHPEQSKQALGIVESEYKRECAEELDTQAKHEARFKSLAIDESKGSAVSYIAKYISKNIDSHGLNNAPDHETDSEKTLGDTVQAVTGWASLWRARQFQFFGLAPVGLWRELRRITGDYADQRIKDLLEAVNRKDDQQASYARFDELHKGVELVTETDRGGDYLDPIKRITGVLIDGFYIPTRAGRWVREALTDARREALKTSGSLFTWTRLNKCNHTENLNDIETAVYEKTRLDKSSGKEKHIFLEGATC